ncbi:MAG: 4'-phosphopantetheinyl transferase superfamily protein [Erysipelotrichia bacterium]|nr:4'-phosphopantetheinyl transferase superfamily protein [Erysipelotrichia bacterium]
MSNVHLLIVDINLGKKYHSLLLEKLSESQIAKMLKFAKENDQLRSLLSSYLKNQLSNSEEKINEFGKPYFPDAPRFNISHSGKYLVMALADKEIGIDIEENVTRNFSVLKKIFNEAEVKFLKNQEDFYYLWCSKESLIKCLGTTINMIKDIPSLPLNGIKTYRGINYRCHSLIYDNHIISITLKSSRPFNVHIDKIQKLPFIFRTDIK